MGQQQLQHSTPHLKKLDAFALNSRKKVLRRFADVAKPVCAKNNILTTFS